MKEQTCCFTGHRKIPLNERAAIQERLESEIVELVRQGVRYFGAGGALGFDTMAAQAVIRLRPALPHIRLILVLPCKNQTMGWKEADIKIYNRIREEADKVVYTSEGYYEGCMRKRNRHLVDSSRFCVCYLTGAAGGAAYTAGYAADQGLFVINIACKTG